MDHGNKYRISFVGEFTDKSLEEAYLAENLDSSRRITAYMALVFGGILGLFLMHSYLTERGTVLFANVTPVRLAFIFASVLVFLTARRITKHKQLVLMNSFYQAMMAVVYLLTLHYFQTLNYFSVLGLMTITLAMYLLPNRVVHSQVVSFVFSILFFVFPIRKLEGLQVNELYRIITYQAIMLVHCNIYTCWVETTKRKTFVAKRELLELSSKDPLTGIYNRKMFDDAVDQWMGFSERYSHPLSIILFDVDNFKEVNDTYGHIEGDRVLKDLAAVVKQSIRSADVFARWGGDEFAILLPNTDLPQAKKLAERLKGCLANNNPLEGPIKITCSFGVAQYEPNETKQSLLRKVDDLLLEAKTGGRDRIVG
ncbi:MAG: GGDEF domain-containing protein [Limnochordia bacterium]